jgi:hypothetical protein
MTSAKKINLLNYTIHAQFCIWSIAVINPISSDLKMRCSKNYRTLPNHKQNISKHPETL